MITKEENNGKEICKYEIGQCLHHLETNPSEIFINTTWEHCESYGIDKFKLGFGICSICKGKWRRRS